MSHAPSFICLAGSLMGGANKNGERVIDLLTRRARDPFPDVNAALMDLSGEVKAWVQNNPNGDAPRVLTVLPAAWAGNPPVDAARQLTALATNIGSVTLWFILAGQGSAVLFPSTAENLPRASAARRLFELASILPAHEVGQATAEGLALRPQPRALLLADLAKLPEFVRFYLTTTS